MTRTLFEDVMIFDCSGAPLFPDAVLVAGARIAAVARKDETLNARDACVIEGKGRTLMPGMVEAHAHLTWPSSVERVIDAMHLPIEEHMLVTAQNAH